MKRAICLGLLAAGAALPAQASEELAKKYACVSCHNVRGAKTVGPTYVEIAKKYAGQGDAEAKLVEKVKKGGAGVWGQVPMPANPNVPDGDVRALVKWILATR
ncbi:MAG: c-type cytochrome [Burkholderiales bacterium]|nr:c-type cytochrome [Burkholderiales bacterium]